jgi:hypothetical protein
MKVKLALLLAVLALVSIAAFAQSGIVGKWVGELSSKDGHGVSQPITIDLKMEGEALSGTVTEGSLDARPIQGASVEGSTVTFRTVRNFGGPDINVNWKGELKGDDLTLTREIGPAPAEAGGGRGGGRGGGGAAGGRGGGRGGAAPAAGAQRGAAADVPPVPNRIRRALQRPMALQEVPVDAVLQPVPLEVVEGVLDVAAALLLPRQLYLRGRQ